MLIFQRIDQCSSFKELINAHHVSYNLYVFFSIFKEDQYKVGRCMHLKNSNLASKQPVQMTSSVVIYNYKSQDSNL